MRLRRARWPGGGLVASIFGYLDARSLCPIAVRGREGEGVGSTLWCGGKYIREWLQTVNNGTEPGSRYMLTTRASLGVAFFAVRGVLPRSFPGVLKSSATFLSLLAV